ncbi:TolC family protein [bacterium]|nr:TolC family protein [bacterium]
MKKIFLLALFVLNFFCYPKTTLEVLWDSIIENNSEVNSVRTNYKNALIDYVTLQGLYIPSVNLNSIVNLGENYSKGDYPSYINNTLSIGQRLPGGSQLVLDVSYNLSYADYNEETYVNQIPKIGLTFSQSMFPFYLQGKLCSPDVQLLKINKEYQEKYYDYICKEKIKSVTREYIYALIYGKKSEIYESSIKLKNQKKEIIKKLIDQGRQNQSNLIEIENSLLMDIQNKAEIFSSYVQCINNLTLLTGANFYDLSDFSLEELPDIEILENDGLEKIDCYDAYERMLLLNIKKFETQSSIIKQDNAPYISFNLTDIINLNDKKACDWKDSWTDWKDDKKNTWAFGIGVDFTNFFKGNYSKQYDKNNNELQSAKSSYYNYLEQKKKLFQIYKKSLESLESEILSTEELIENNEKILLAKTELMEKGLISEFEYINALEEFKILKLTYENYCLFRWLYNFLIFIDSDKKETV